MPLLLIPLLLQALAAQATVFNATFSWYGQGDSRGSPNCRNASPSCGFRASGFTAAVSQNLFGASSGSGPYCGKCLKLNAVTDAYNANPLKNPGRDIIIMVDNLCPKTSTDGTYNPLCAMKTLNDTNSFGGSVDVNLCSDSGARDVVFGVSSGSVGLARGTAEEVSCAGWEGSTGTGQGLIGGSSSRDGAVGMSLGVRGVRMSWGMRIVVVGAALAVRFS